jgi:hypothetical protein
MPRQIDQIFLVRVAGCGAIAVRLIAPEAAVSISRPGRASQLTKNYAVGLEMSCPGGAYHWAPEIPSTRRIAGPTPSKCELAHNRGSFFPKLGWAQVRARNS